MKKKAQGYIEIKDLDLEVPFFKEKSILEVLNKNDIEIDQSCDGMGTCGTCRVIVLAPSELPSRNEIEQERADFLAFRTEERLSCQLAPIDKIQIQILK